MEQQMTVVRLILQQEQVLQLLRAVLGESAALDIIVFKWWAAKSNNRYTTIRYRLMLLKELVNQLLLTILTQMDK
jgi:hypothetical protein